MMLAAIPNSNSTLTLTCKTQFFHSLKQSPFPKLSNLIHLKPHLLSALGELGQITKLQEDFRPTFRWIEIDLNEINDAQRNHIARLPKKLTNRCRALMKQLICFSPEKSTSSSLSLLLSAWVRSMKPVRADWLVVLKELDNINHPLRLQVYGLSLYLFTCHVLIHFGKTCYVYSFVVEINVWNFSSYALVFDLFDISICNI